MTSRRSNKFKPFPDVAIELRLDERYLDFAFSDNGEGDPERLIIELEEAGDLHISVTEDDNGNHKIEFFINED